MPHTSCRGCAEGLAFCLRLGRLIPQTGLFVKISTVAALLFVILLTAWCSEPSDIPVTGENHSIRSKVRAQTPTGADFSEENNPSLPENVESLSIVRLRRYDCVTLCDNCRCVVCNVFREKGLVSQGILLTIDVTCNVDQSRQKGFVIATPGAPREGCLVVKAPHMFKNIPVIPFEKTSRESCRPFAEYFIQDDSVSIRRFLSTLSDGSRFFIKVKIVYDDVENIYVSWGKKLKRCHGSAHTEVEQDSCVFHYNLLDRSGCHLSTKTPYLQL